MLFVRFVALLAALPFGWGSQVKHCDHKQAAGSLERGESHSCRQTRRIHHHRPHRRHRVRGSKAPSSEFPPRIIDHPSDLIVQKDKPATLNCRAEGNPEPTIKWYRNGEQVETSKHVQHPQRVLLPGGSLFFYQLKGKSDEGVYMCVARNHLGTASSRNSSLYIMALKDDFRLHPSKHTVSVGNPLLMECLPPRGHPEPTVTWKKDGVTIEPNDGHVTVTPGKLAISYALKSDAGVYVCVATNEAGQKESRGAQISVLEKPVITIKPGNLVTRSGSSVQFLCEVQGDPKPIVRWNKEGGELPQERYEITRENTLRIKHVTSRDAGTYICTAETKIESVSAQGLLVVRVPDVAPQNINVTRVEGGNGAIIVSWEAPPMGDYNTNITGYKVWCFGNETFNQSNWIVDKETKHLKIPALASGFKYQVQVAAITNTGIGTPSKPKDIFLETTDAEREDEDVLSLDFVLQVLRHPAFIASAGAIAWIVLMMAAIYICQHHSKRYSTKTRSVMGNGLYRFASEDTIIKHRMDTSDSPWLSNTWKSTSCSRNYSSTTSMNSQFLWPETKDMADFHRSTISFERKSEGSRSQIIPLVPDGGILCGALYADLPGRDMATFQRPLPATPCGRVRPVPLGLFDQSSLPQIFSNNHLYGADPRHKLQRKPTDPSSPSISLKDSWVHNLKKELHQVNSAPLSPSHHTAESGSTPGFKPFKQSLGGKGDSAKVMKTFSSPKILQYTSSLQVMDLLPFTALPPPPVPPPCEEPLCDPHGDKVSFSFPATGQAANEDRLNNYIKGKTPPTTLNLKRASFASLSNGDNVLTPEDVAKYLELGEDNTGLNSVCDSTLPRPVSSAHTYGYIYSPLPSDLLESPQQNEDYDLELEDVNSLKSYRKYCETPTSSISEYESSMAGSLVNGWGSVSEDNYTSARCSMVSSSDGSFLMDASFAKALAVASFCFCEAGAAERLCTDLAPASSPLEGTFFGNNPGQNGETPKRGKCSALPVLDWNIDWMEEMESKYSQKSSARLLDTYTKKVDSIN